MTLSWKPTRFDLALAVVLALGLPFVAGFLYRQTGALLPMLLYYGLAWGVALWRRGDSGYRNPMPKNPPVWFWVNLGVIALSLVAARLSPVVTENPHLAGVLLTALFWAPINAASEQLLWLYLFDAWDLYPESTHPAFRGVGLLLFAAFVGMIHTMFWVHFLTTVQPEPPWGVLFILLTTLSGFLHIVVWRQSKQMIFTFIPHLLLNLGPLFWTGYTILPYLLTRG
ncbi:MAG: hypothetical protein Fur0018_23420 [Anaerolineales bacterium]